MKLEKQEWYELYQEKEMQMDCGSCLYFIKLLKQEMFERVVRNIENFFERKLKCKSCGREDSFPLYLSYKPNWEETIKWINGVNCPNNCLEKQCEQLKKMLNINQNS